MKRIITTTTGASVGPWIPLNYDNAQVGISLQCVVTGSATYTIEHTLDNMYPQDANGILNQTVTATAFPHGVANLVGATSNQEGNYVLPVAATRINQTVGTGSVTMTIIQEGIIG